MLEIINWGSYLVRTLNIKKPMLFNEKELSTIIEWLSDCIDTWCSKHDQDKSVLMEWKGTVTVKIDEKIKTLSNKTFSTVLKSVLEQNNPLNTLINIHNQIVVTSVDKAKESVAFIRKQFYELVLIITQVQIKLIFQYIKLIIKLSPT